MTSGGAGLIDRACKDGRAGNFFDGKRLTRYRRLVHKRIAAHYVTIDRYSRCRRHAGTVEHSAGRTRQRILWVVTRKFSPVKIDECDGKVRGAVEVA